MTLLKYKLLAITITLSPQYGMAANAINIIGFGTESTGMGGADLAVARDTSALNTNPAGLNQIDHAQLDIYLAHAKSAGTNHTDSFGNNSSADIGGNFIELGYASNAGEKKSTWGVGLFVQGGLGAEYTDMTTAFGTIDSISQELTIVRATPGVAWQINPQTVFGVTALLTYASGNQSFFPDTSFNGTSPEQSFFGFTVDDVSTFTAAIKLGVMHKFNNDTTLGITYTSETKLTLDGGNMTVNFSAIGLGKVHYQNASIGGLNLPQEIGVGLAHQLNDQWLLAADISWLNWQHAARQTFISARNPDNALAPPTISQTLPLDWNDQWVLALGAEYKIDNEKAVRFGFNQANNPVPNQRLTPTISAIATRHITAGYMQQLNKHWNFSTALEYQLPENKTYSNLNQPFGTDAGIEVSLLVIHAAMSYRW